VSSPSTSGYLGTPAMVAVISFLVFGMVRMTIRQRQIRRGDLSPVNSKHENYAFVMAIWSFMLVMAILAILEHHGIQISNLLVR
jgi:hypothetical protein